MAKAILEFDLNEPDDRDEHNRMLRSLDIVLVLWDIDQYLRSQTKYNENLTQEQWDALDQTRTKFYEIMNERNVSLDELLS
jgi:hypothetical protein